MHIHVYTKNPFVSWVFWGFGGFFFFFVGAGAKIGIITCHGFLSFLREFF